MFDLNELYWTIHRPAVSDHRLPMMPCAGGIWHVFNTCTVLSFWYYLFESYSLFCTFYAFLRGQWNTVPVETLQSWATHVQYYIRNWKQTFWCMIKHRPIACLPTGHLYLLSSAKYLNMYSNIKKCTMIFLNLQLAFTLLFQTLYSNSYFEFAFCPLPK